jgi:hypothetical protein
MEKFRAVVYTIINVPEGKYYFDDLGVDGITILK